MLSEHIYTLLKTKPNQEKYLSVYIRYLNRCNRINKDKSPEHLGVLEDHHILPKAKDMFPDYQDRLIHPWNSVKLTAVQHVMAHWLLWKSYGYGSQSLAFHFMTNKNGVRIKSLSVIKKLKEDESRRVRELTKRGEFGAQREDIKARIRNTVRRKRQEDPTYGRMSAEALKKRKEFGRKEAEAGLCVFQQPEFKENHCKANGDRMKALYESGYRYEKTNEQKENNARANREKPQREIVKALRSLADELNVTYDLWTSWSNRSDAWILEKFEKFTKIKDDLIKNGKSIEEYSRTNEYAIKTAQMNERDRLAGLAADKRRLKRLRSRPELEQVRKILEYNKLKLKDVGMNDKWSVKSDDYISEKIRELTEIYGTPPTLNFNS